MAGSKRKKMTANASSEAELALGESDRPNRARRSTAKSAVTFIDEAFAERIKFTVNGAEYRATVLEGIILQLLRKAMLRDKRALRVLMMYQKFAFECGERDDGVQLILVESEYTRSIRAFVEKASNIEGASQNE